MTTLTGRQILKSSALTKSTAFSREERRNMGLHGLLPHAESAMEVQVQRVLANLRRKTSDIEKYIFLTALHDRNERLFFRTVQENIEEIMPLIYTPTVGQACREFAHIFRQPRGFYITPDDRGCIRDMLDNWEEEDIRVIVVTDGERILGLGDLGANGMGIPIGKLALYTACGGIPPRHCLPVMIDVGTNNVDLLKDPMYLGYPHRRIAGAAYDDLVEEFIEAVNDKYPGVLVQFEDFLTPNAYALLNRYRDQILCFNDDIQGTAAVALAGVKAAARLTNKQFSELKIMFLGAGSAATGIGDLMTVAMIQSGLSPEAARQNLWFVDKDGLVVESRQDLMPHNRPYAHRFAPMGFQTAIEAIRPDVLIGATGVPGVFTETAIRTMAQFKERPVVFALSNPTSRAECTAEQAYAWSDNRAIFASGSPFAPVQTADSVRRPGQGNNAYIFPGIGLGAIVAKARRLDDAVFLAAADALANSVTEAQLASGAVYPPLDQIGDVSRAIALATARSLLDTGLSNLSEEDALDLETLIDDYQFNPKY